MLSGLFRVQMWQTDRETQKKIAIADIPVAICNLYNLHIYVVEHRATQLNKR